MPTSYTSILKLALPATGELSGTWGDVVNNNITSMVEQAIAGLATINSWTTNSHTLTTANGTTSESRCAMLVLDDDGLGNPTAAATVICPAATKIYIVKNICGQTATVKTAAGTGVAIPNNSTAIVFCDGTNVVEGSTYSSTVNIDGGTIDNTVIGGTTPAAGSFTTLSASSTTTLSALTASQAVFTNASKQLVSNAITGTGNVVMSASPTLTGTLTADAITASSTITGNGNWVIGNADTDTVTIGASFVTGSVLRSAKVATNTLALAAYDVDGAAYTNLITLTASNTPTLTLTSTGVGTINNMSIGATTASTGAFTTLSASSTVSGAGFSTYLASPPAIGGTTPAAGSFTTLSANNTVTFSGSLAANGGVTLGDASGDALTIGSNTATINNTLTFAYEDATTNTVVDTVRVRRTSSGVPALGIGAGFAFEVETAASNVETGATLDVVTTDVTAASEDFDFVVNLMTNGAAAAEKFRVTSAGDIKSATATFTGAMSAGSLAGTAATGSGASGTWGISISGDAASVDGKSFGTFTAAGGVLYATSTTAASAIGAGTSGQPLLSGGAGAPTWGTLSVGAGGTGQTSYTDGQLLIGNTTGNTLTKATLTAGTAISVTNGAGAITIANTGVTSLTGTANQVTVSASTGGVTLSLPASINVNTTGSAATLTTSRNINGTAFNGSADITTANWGTARTLWGQSVNGSANITAPLLPAAGAVGAPAFSTSGDTNTGIYFPAADTIGFSAGGSERMRLDSSGNLLVGTTSGSWHSLYKTNAGGQVLQVVNESTDTNSSVMEMNVRYAGSTSTWFIRGGDGSVYRFYIQTNGNVINSNNSYGAISDLKNKENIVDATPKLQKLNQVRVVNYNLIGDSQKQIGVVAQELEQIFPSMIQESPDRDADGKDLGTTTKSVKYSVFVPILIKAIQEQQAMINELRNEIAALKGA